MVTAASCGMMPEQFYRATLGEIIVVIEGARERERRSTISRVVAAVRALSAALGGGGDPLDGLGEHHAAPVQITAAAAKWLRFWRRPNG